MDENKIERFIEKEEVNEEMVNKSVNIKKGRSGKKSKVITIVVIIVIIIGAIVVYLSLSGSGDTNTNNVIIPPENTNLSTNEDSNLNVTNTPSTNITVNEEVTLTGRVFIKAYGTPSESYGILSTDGNEIGFEAYDSMREQFRPYVNENVSVTFSNICKSTADNCCKSVFFYCGTVSDWEPLEDTNSTN